MTIDVRQKGATAETNAKKELILATGLKWERVPGSGALDPKHGLKGDLYVPNANNNYCVEVKHYKDCHIDHSLISGKSPQLLEWWKQTVRQGLQVDKKPLLIFKHDRSKFYCAFMEEPYSDMNYILVSSGEYMLHISLLSDFLKYNKPEFV